MFFEFGDEEIEEVRRRLMDSIEPLFGAHERATFLFQGPIWYLEKL